MTIMTLTLSQPVLAACRTLTHMTSFGSRRGVSLSCKQVTPITLQKAKELLMEMVGTPSSYGMADAVPPKEIPCLPNSQEELPARHMKDSYREVIIPLGQDPKVQDKYISFMKGMRFGRILEDLDVLAGLICYTHFQDPNEKGVQKLNVANVTAAVDRIELYNTNISPYLDVKMCGHITWVGRSSMEVTMNVEQEIRGIPEKMLTARFLMVARNPHTKGAAVVNPLEPEGPKEVELFQLGEKNKIRRQEEAKRSLLKTAPNKEERNIIHEIFLRTIDQKSGTFRVRIKPENTVWMQEAKLKTLSICHPEQRNIYGKIFGGFLMRKAYELAYANASLFCKARPVLSVVDDVIFLQPVEIGSLLFFSSQIVYTVGSLMQVRVHAEVLDILTGSRNTTNYFYFAFDSKNPCMPQVMPYTYAESMLYLDGIRHLKE